MGGGGSRGRKIGPMLASGRGARTEKNGGEIERPDMGKIGTGPHPHPEGFKKGGKVRGTGIAKKGFRPCKMR